MERYTEAENIASEYRKNYMDGLTALIKRKQAEKNKERVENFTKNLGNLENARLEFKKMLGWPLVTGDSHKPSMRIEYLGKDDDAFIFRTFTDVFDNYAFYGILFLKGDTSKEFDVKNIEKKPLVISQHGGLGTPEFCSGIYGDTANYNDMTRRILKNDVHVFAPQMLIWDPERYKLDFERWDFDRDLKQLGSSITAVEIYSLQKVLDILSEKPYIDGDKIGMIGLSYGGFYTLFTAACDKRIKSCISCSFVNDRIKYNWPDWTWFDAAGKFFDAEIAALVAPRYLHIQVGDHDEVFDYATTGDALAQTKKYFEALGCSDKLKITVFDGKHEFCKDDDAIREMIEKLYE